MLKGLTDYIFNIQDIDSLHDQLDITNIVKEYFKENGYDFIKPQDEDDEDDWDEEW